MSDPMLKERHLTSQHKYRRSQKYYLKIRKDYLELKTTVFSHYSKPVIQCEICGEKRLPCLSIDHINGGGSKHRKAIGQGGHGFYLWLKKNDYPEGFRILCMNCQFVVKAELGQVRGGKHSELQ